MFTFSRFWYEILSKYPGVKVSDYLESSGLLKSYYFSDVVFFNDI